jgi:hypothetical protein
MTPDQINGLDAEQRANIMQLVSVDVSPCR